MNQKTKYKVKLVLEIPFESHVDANNESEAVDMALDNAMDYLELNLSDSRKFDQLWEYVVKHKAIEVEKA